MPNKLSSKVLISQTYIVCVIRILILSGTIFLCSLAPAKANIPGGGCQTYFCKGGLMMAAEYGSELETKERVVEFKHGKVLVLTGRNSLALQVSLGHISIARKSACIVQVTDSGVLRVNNLQGNTVSVELDNDAKNKVHLMPCEELCVGDEDESLQGGELEPVDGVTRQIISLQIIGHKKVLTNRFDATAKFQKEPLRVCHPFYRKANSRIKCIEKLITPVGFLPNNSSSRK